MSHRERVTAIAAKYGLSNDPGLKESDLTIEMLVFTTKEGRRVPIPKTEYNKASRLFFMDLAVIEGSDAFDIDDSVRQMAAEYYEELWENDPEPGKRPLLDAIRVATSVRIIRK